MPAELRDPVTPKQKRERAGEDPAKRRAARAEWYAQHVWAPNRLRHNAATRLRKDYGLEAAQVILGHRTLTVTQVYAEKNRWRRRRSWPRWGRGGVQFETSGRSSTGQRTV